MLSRRLFIQTILAAIALPKRILFANGLLSNNAFKFPSLDFGKRNGRDVYFNLNIQQGFSDIIANKKTKTWGINQDFLGVTLQANKGDRVHIKVTNHLHQTTTLHWHGMKLPANADGGPHQPIEPKQTWLSEFDIIQPAATTWYHSHQLHKTGEQVYQGLAGLFIINDEVSNAMQLPSEYGVDDFPVIIQDRDFNRDGSFSYINSMHDKMMGKLGNVVLVNGVIKPVLNTKKPLIRLRILNGSNARTYHLSFDDNRHFYIIGSDGGLLEKIVKSNSITLSPSERMEILVDITDGTSTTLRHKSANDSMGGMGMGMMNRMMGGAEDFNILQINASKIDKTQFKLPEKLASHPQINKKITQKRYFDLQMKMGPMMMLGNAFSINGKTMNINRIDEVVKAGSTEVWVVKNSSMMAHPFHIHNVQFKIISKPNIKPYERGFKDTVLIEPNSIVELLIEFPSYKDRKNPYMYHCHILEHEDQGMMGQFVVV